MVLGIDIGGTKTALGLVDRRGRASARAAFPTGKTALRTLAALRKAVAARLTKKVRAIGIGVAGQVDWKRGIVRSGPNLPFRNLRLRELIAREFHRPVAVDNDVHCFTLAESALGAGRDHDSVFGIMLGTGIGGGFVSKGKIVHGATNTAAEIGHLAVAPGKTARCSCGGYDHLEAFAGGRALAHRYRALTRRAVDAKALERDWRAGKKMARAVVGEAQEALAVGFATILTVFNPDCVIVGGGLARFRGLWYPAIARARALVPFPELKKVPIVSSKLGSDAVLIGAALLARIRN